MLRLPKPSFLHLIADNLHFSKGGPPFLMAPFMFRLYSFNGGRFLFRVGWRVLPVAQRGCSHKGAPQGALELMGIVPDTMAVFQ